MALDGLMSKYGMGAAPAAPADPMDGADDLAASLTADDGADAAGGSSKLDEALRGIGHTLDPAILSQIQSMIDGAGGAANTMGDDESLEGSDPMADDVDIAKGGIAQGVKPKARSKFGAMGA